MAGSRTKSEQAEADLPRLPLILDSGAIIALSRGDLRPRRFLEHAATERLPVLVSPAGIAETVRGSGPRDAAVNRVLNDVDAVPPITEETGRIAGRLLGKAGSDSTIDALVVAQAVELGGARVLTSDPDDFTELAADTPDIIIHAI